MEGAILDLELELHLPAFACTCLRLPCSSFLQCYQTSTQQARAVAATALLDTYLLLP